MRQIFYVSDSLVGGDARQLADIMSQSQDNNAVDGITGLLWTDGHRFAQVIEGGDDAVDHLMKRLRADQRHTNMTVLDVAGAAERQYGAWAMVQPAGEALADLYEQRVKTFLARASEPISSAFLQIIASSR